jgi:hypothetical protein
MAKYSKKHLLSEKSKDDVMKIARGTQKPGQTKEQTKLIAQGIQKCIEIYKKKQSEKTRELDKIQHPEVQHFLATFSHSYALTLDELLKK